MGFQTMFLELSPPTPLKGVGSEETGFSGFCSLEVFMFLCSGFFFLCLFVCLFFPLTLAAFDGFWRFRGKQTALQPPSQREASVCSPLGAAEHISSPLAAGRARSQLRPLGTKELLLVPKIRTAAAVWAAPDHQKGSKQ